MTWTFSDRINRVEPSATLAISALASELRTEGADVIDLGVGEPDFPTPEPIITAATEAMNAGHTGYTPPPGIPPLREAIAEKLQADGLDYQADQLIVTPGAKQALYATIQALVDDGDSVAVLDPAWVSYEAMVKLAGGELTRIDLAAHDFRLAGGGLDAAREALSDDTDVLIVNTPSNPTGVVYEDEALEALCELAITHDITVISDEIYERICYGRRPQSVAAIDGMADRTVTINGFSKAYSMTGWRLGYLAAPAAVIEQVGKLHSHSVSCATHFVQRAGITALKECESDVEAMVEAFEERRDLLVDRLTDAGVDLPVVPDGAFYLMVPVQGTDTETCERVLAEQHVATTPGTAFGTPGYARISYANSVERIEAAIDRLEGADFFA